MTPAAGPTGLNDPVIALDLPTYQLETFGPDETFYQIVRNLARPGARTSRVSCNLLGRTRLDFRHCGDVTEIASATALQTH